MIFRLDADYLESAAAVSQKLYEKIQRMKQGGGIALPASQKAASIRLRRFPWLGGVGPLAWRQILIAVRTSRYALIISLGIAVVLGVLAFVVDRRPDGTDFVSSMSVGFMAYLTFIFAMQLPWAFRGDIVHMDCLKSLPVAPLSVAIGELAGGVTLLSGIQFVLLVALLGAGGSPGVLVSAIAFVIPFDLLILGDVQHGVLDLSNPFSAGNFGGFPDGRPDDADDVLADLAADSGPGRAGHAGRAGVCAQRLSHAGLRGGCLDRTCG